MTDPERLEFARNALLEIVAALDEWHNDPGEEPRHGDDNEHECPYCIAFNALTATEADAETSAAR